MKNQSVMTHQFSEVPKAEIPRSSFDRSHGLKTTFDGGFLIPIFVDEALPGDTFNLKMTAFARLNTPIVPVMDNMTMTTFFFSVPNRLIWDNWQKFNGEQTDPGDSIDFTIPKLAGKSWSLHEMGDYFGIPTGVTMPGGTVSALPFRAFNLIWNEWFRDQNLQTSLTVPKGDGPDASPGSLYAMQRRGKRHDYFTSCLPWPQKGDSVPLPLGTIAPVVATALSPKWSGSDGALGAGQGATLLSDGHLLAVGQGGAGVSMWFGDETGLQTDLTNATAATINELRQSFQVQKLQERDARGGTRYTEIIRAHFGVSSPDARLQRPEYLGGGSSPINITPVPSTTWADVGQGAGTPIPQGSLSGFGTASLSGHGFTKSFTEHCTLIGLISVQADITYQQGLNRMWSRATRYDFYWPALSHIGEQSVLNGEIYAQGDANDQLVFGYQERYAEYRYKPSQITGQFRSTDALSLDVWHLSQDFATLPTLNATFIADTPPIDRIVAVTTDLPQFKLDAYFSLRCARPMPLYGVPGMIDHF